jgi:hypothetical protein
MSTDTDLGEFATHGFTVLPGLLPLTAVVELSRAINRDVKHNPFMWHRFSGSVVNRNAILSVPGIAEIVLDPRVLGLVDAIFEGEGRFEEAVVMLYDAGAEEAETDWHRDVPHNLENRYRAEYVQLLVYLSDVGPDARRFAIHPESREDPIVAPTELVATRQPFEFVGAPGSAILFNASAIHGAQGAPGGRGRRSLHIYYGHKDRPCSSESTIVPERLLRSLGPRERRLFEKRNRLSALIFS